MSVILWAHGTIFDTSLRFQHKKLSWWIRSRTDFLGKEAKPYGPKPYARVAQPPFKVTTMEEHTMTISSWKLDSYSFSSSKMALAFFPSIAGGHWPFQCLQSSHNAPRQLTQKSEPTFNSTHKVWTYGSFSFQTQPSENRLFCWTRFNPLFIPFPACFG